MHADPGTEADAGDPGCRGFRMDALDPVEGACGIRQLADPVVEYTLALADAAEVEAERGEVALDEGLIEQLHDLVVHRAARLRVRMQDQRNGRARPGAGVETAFKATLGAGKNDF